jgi:TolA-binding protein
MEEMLMRAPVFAAALTLASMAGAPSWAQTERLPLTSPSEAHVNSVNRSLALQQQLRAQGPQTQFEVNQLRGEIQRIRQFPLMTGPGAARGCPPGSVGC